ncbi:MAG: phenylacetate--CoA ligase family protein [Saprospiraceae bacterium]|nr:phenylacetate--CoA ligase family protein [Saprospiraceae bacterium]
MKEAKFYNFSRGKVPLFITSRMLSQEQLLGLTYYWLSSNQVSLFYCYIYNQIIVAMIRVITRKWMFISGLYLLNLKKAYNKYAKTLLLQQDGSQFALHKLLSSAHENVPYYRENLPKFENNANLINTFKELKFVTQKSQIKNSISEFINPALVRENNLMSLRSNKFLVFLKFYKKDIIFPMSTGGSSGSPLNFYIGKNRGLKFIMQFIAVAKTIGWKEGEPYMACMQGGMYQQSNLISKLLPFIGTPAFVFREINLKTANIFAAHYTKYRPVILFSSPSFLSEIALLLEETKIKLPGKIKGIMCIGEMLLDSQRKIIESYFNARVFNIYASNEMGTIAVECKEHNGLHILESSVFLENDADLNILGTAFDSECQPFIKYNIGDIGKIQFEECACGIKGNKIIDLRGRIEEYIIDKNDNRIHASYLRQLLINTNHLYENTVVNGQFVQKKDRDIHFRLQLNSDKYTQQVIEHVKREIKLICNLDSYGNSTISLAPATGKFRFFYREN